MNKAEQLQQEIPLSYKIDEADLNALEGRHPTSSGAEAGGVIRTRDRMGSPRNAGQDFRENSD